MTNCVPQFWRDPALPAIEARSIIDGRKVCYALHAHAHFSIGVITSGTCTYINGEQRQAIRQGASVLMNPQAVHACNPIDEQPWSYRMLYVDCQWLAGVQASVRHDSPGVFQAYQPVLSISPTLYDAFNQFYDQLLDTSLTPEIKKAAALAFFQLMDRTLAPQDGTVSEPELPHVKLELAAAFIRENCAQPLSLQQISDAAGLSRSYMIRAFRRHFGMTPHAYLTNQRIQLAQRLLKRGELIVDAALAAGFADQAHLQRTFKQFLAATPGQYRG
ncbi:AraC family transcriptional regulator [Pseudomonas sp. M30-35]|uniref:AraC family transcriptional regulator n=1 Tax=Pseudomonas sp. M30-35 TaxID=1981174 RepID=UPI000B3C6DF4|nr:AraC family transcriptional regulator [Pseudomonas sp. M30-35]ARU89312.1 AraC family transcriptional regulator [Pseudomonas sp. M30-35]